MPAKNMPVVAGRLVDIFRRSVTISGSVQSYAFLPDVPSVAVNTKMRELDCSCPGSIPTKPQLLLSFSQFCPFLLWKVSLKTQEHSFFCP